jgi:SAM-dependent methyltransferase
VPLEQIELQLDPDTPVPKDVAAFVAEADRRVDELFETERNRQVPRYLPSDAWLFHRGLAEVSKRGLALGEVFCELGSGFGIATGIASLLGYDAYGVEIEPELVERSSALADEMGVGSTIIESSYIPYGYEGFTGVGGDELLEPGDFPFGGGGSDGPPVYEDMPVPINEIDVIYAYPWPGEQEFMLSLFRALAGDGALLLAYYGEGELCAYRQVLDSGRFG